MVWNGIKRRATDHGQESVEVVLARIDERVGNFLENHTQHIKDFKAHLEDDKQNFKFLNRTAWGGLGALGALEIVLRFFLHK